MKKSRLAPISKRRIQQLFDEEPERRALCERADGTFYHWVGTFNQPDGTVCQMPVYFCANALCECPKHKGKSRVRGNVEPHELVKRSKGGKVSRENSIMVFRNCHIELERGNKGG